MSTRIHTKIARTIAATLVLAAIVAPSASADSAKGVRVQIPPSMANFREPGSTGYVPKATRVVIPPALSRLREPGSTGFVPQGVAAQPSAGDLATGDALNKRYHLGKYGPAVQAGPRPATMTTQQWQAELARGDALNQRYGLGAYAEPGHTAAVMTVAPSRVDSIAADGFDWGSATIGAGVALGLALAGAGALMVLRKRRTLAHA